MGTKIDSAVKWATSIASDNSHGYDQINRWGPNYDCSSLVISAYEQAGVKVKSNGATYTGNMYSVFKKCGFNDVTKSVNLSNGSGLKKGDVLLNVNHHTAMMISSTKLVQASINENGKITGGRSGDQTGREIRTGNYYSYDWDYVLRYSKESESADDDSELDNGDNSWLPLYDTLNSREDATVREIGYIDKSNKPSINTSSIKLSAINYTTLLGSVFDSLIRGSEE